MHCLCRRNYDHHSTSHQNYVLWANCLPRRRSGCPREQLLSSAPHRWRIWWVHLSPSVSPYSGSKALASAFWSQGASPPKRGHLIGAHRDPGAGWVGVEVKMTPRQRPSCTAPGASVEVPQHWGFRHFFFFGPGFGHTLQWEKKNKSDSSTFTCVLLGTIH